MDVVNVGKYEVEKQEKYQEKLIDCDKIVVVFDAYVNGTIAIDIFFSFLFHEKPIHCLCYYVLTSCE